MNRTESFGIFIATINQILNNNSIHVINRTEYIVELTCQYITILSCAGTGDPSHLVSYYNGQLISFQDNQSSL